MSKNNFYTKKVNVEKVNGFGTFFIDIWKSEARINYNLIK